MADRAIDMRRSCQGRDLDVLEFGLVTAPATVGLSRTAAGSEVPVGAGAGATALAHRGPARSAGRWRWR